ncbi:transcriptional regulator [Escherichia coli]|nr:transcriptional regulator [Escherichia coli]
MPSLSRARAEASFRNNHPAYRYGSATVTSPFISPAVTFPIIFTFLPGCYAGEGGALFS